MPCENARQLLHVPLGVDGVHAQGVQLQQLATQIFIGARHRILFVVQVAQHGWVVHHGAQEVPEASQGMRADGALFVVAHHGPQIGLELVDVEVIEPKPGHVFAHGVRRVQRSPHMTRCSLADEAPQFTLVALLRRAAGLLTHGRILRSAQGFHLTHQAIQGKAGNGHGLDAVLHPGGQTILIGRWGRGLQLHTHPLGSAQFRGTGQIGTVGAPGGAIHQPVQTVFIAPRGAPRGRDPALLRRRWGDRTP